MIIRFFIIIIFYISAGIQCSGVLDIKTVTKIKSLIKKKKYSRIRSVYLLAMIITIPCRVTERRRFDLLFVISDVCVISYYFT